MIAYLVSDMAASLGDGGAASAAGGMASGGPASSAGGFQQIPLGQLVDIRTTSGPPVIRNENGALTGWVYVDISGRNIGGYVNEAKKLVSEKNEKAGLLPTPGGMGQRPETPAQEMGGPFPIRSENVIQNGPAVRSAKDSRRRRSRRRPHVGDLPSAQALSATLHTVLDESNVFRIDHYLGKEPVQNLHSVLAPCAWIGHTLHVGKVVAKIKLTNQGDLVAAHRKLSKAKPRHRPCATELTLSLVARR